MTIGRLMMTALGSLRQNPLRTFLTLLGVIIGVAAVIALLSIGSATTNSVTSRIQGLGTNLLVISPGQSISGGVSQGLGSANSLTMKDVQALRKLSSLSAVAPDRTTRAQVIFGKNNYQTSIEGSTPELFEIRNLELSGGRAFNLVEEQNAAKVAVVGAEVAENLFGREDPVGQTVWIGGLPFRVVGKLTRQGSGGPSNNDDRILVPYSTVRNYFTGEDNPNLIYASAADGNQMNQAQADIERTLRRTHGLSGGEENDFVVANQETLLSTLEGVSATLQMFLGGIAGISLLVGGIGIMNIMLVSVTERTREIGLRKALGATRGAILKQFVVESGLVGLLGGVAGILLGTVISLVAGQVMDLDIRVNPESVWMAFGVSVATGLLFGIYPAWRAARLSPIHALRHE